MKTTIAALAALLLLSGCSKTPPEPNWTLTSAEGIEIELATATSERPQILLFWATWCPYCRALMPHIQSIQMEHAGQFDVLAINIKEDEDPVEHMQRLGFDFTLLPEGDDVAALYEIDSTPGVLIIDTQGRTRFDLRKIEPMDLGPKGKELKHSQRAARLAPYWASEIRKALDGL